MADNVPEDAHEQLEGILESLSDGEHWVLFPDQGHAWIVELALCALEIRRETAREILESGLYITDRLVWNDFKQRYGLED